MRMSRSGFQFADERCNGNRKLNYDSYEWNNDFEINLKNMKKIFKIIVVTFFIAFADSASAQISKVNLQASGLTCSMCNLSIKKAIEKLPFVDAVSPIIETSMYTITFKKNEAIVLQDLKNAVVKAGFSVASFVVDFETSSQLIVENSTIKIDGISYYILENKSKKLSSPFSLKIVDKGFVSDKFLKKYKNLLSQKEPSTIPVILL